MSEDGLASHRAATGGGGHAAATAATESSSLDSENALLHPPLPSSELAVDVLLSRMTHAGVANPKVGVAKPKAVDLQDEVADIVMRIDGSIVGIYLCIYVCVY